LEPGEIRHRLLTTHLCLEGLVRPDPGTGEDHRKIRVRLMTRDEDTHLTDAAVAEALLMLEERLRWSRLDKLQEIDHMPDYPPLPQP